MGRRRTYTDGNPRPCGPLSQTMLAAINLAMANEGKLVRHPGGFWALPDWKLGHGPWFTAQTMRAIVDRGKGEYTRWRVGAWDSQFPVEVRFF